VFGCLSVSQSEGGPWLPCAGCCFVGFGFKKSDSRSTKSGLHQRVDQLSFFAGVATTCFWVELPCRKRVEPCVDEMLTARGLAGSLEPRLGDVCVVFRVSGIAGLGVCACHLRTGVFGVSGIASESLGLPSPGGRGVWFLVRTLVDPRESRPSLSTISAAWSSLFPGCSWREVDPSSALCLLQKVSRPAPARAPFSGGMLLRFDRWTR
jgi:hypothetical protein